MTAAAGPRFSWISWRRLRLTLSLAALLTLVCGAVVVAAAGGPPPRRATPVGLTAFRSDAELRQFLKHLRGTAGRGPALYPMAMPPPMMMAPPAAAKAAAAPAIASADIAVQSRSAPAGAQGITNNQVTGVDEGDIVKMHGETMVILRRGRLFTVSLSGGAMHAIDHINAYPPGVNASDDWYDEMLISGDYIIVIGYSYGRGGTEINRFRIGEDGRLRFEDAYQLRSNDYYSARNYASRLIGSKLILYSPLSVHDQGDVLDDLPALRRWTGQSGKAGFARIASATKIYVSQAMRHAPVQTIDALHTVTTCDVTAPVMNCSAIGVFGPSSRTFYVSGEAVYLWIDGENGDDRPGHAPTAAIYRLPLDGGRPQALGARGGPQDQFSFQEDDRRQVLNVLVRSQSNGDAMWRPEFAQGALALARIPLSSFGDGSRELESWRYRPLPKPKGDDDGSLHNRFVGDYVLYGAGNGWGQPRDRREGLIVAPVDGGPVSTLFVSHGVDRIEALGGDALVVGSGEHTLRFSAIDLTGGPPRVGDVYAQPLAVQAETRSHGFFFQPDADSPDGASGILGLPVARPTTPAYYQLFQSSAAMVFLRRDARKFAPLGELAAHSEGGAADACVASCVDWYGNARPIFIGSRVFALMGYELVEGEVTRAGIHEVGREGFAPRVRTAVR
jgi:hypothetical protein